MVLVHSGRSNANSLGNPPISACKLSRIKNWGILTWHAVGLWCMGYSIHYAYTIPSLLLAFHICTFVHLFIPTIYSIYASPVLLALLSRPLFYPKSERTLPTFTFTPNLGLLNLQLCLRCQIGIVVNSKPPPPLFQLTLLFNPTHTVQFNPLPIPQ